MTMQTRLYAPSDYATVREWWMMRGVCPVPSEHLPSLGYVVEGEDGPLAMVWVYQDNSTKWAFLAWPVARPGVGGTMVDAVFVELFARLAQDLAGRVVNIMSERHGLNRWLERHGFTLSCAGVSGFIKQF
jgi:hypothetical protein